MGAICLNIRNRDNPSFIEALDLAVPVQKIKSVSEKSFSLASFLVPPPQYSKKAIEPNPLSAQEVYEQIKPLAEAFSGTVDYNGLNLVEQFIGHSKAQEEDLERLVSFQPDTEEEVSRFRGGICTDLSRNLLSQFPNAVKARGCALLTERNGPDQPAHHALIGIFCSDGGVVLVDPSLHAIGQKAVVVYPGAPASGLNIYSCPLEFSLDLDKGVIKKTTVSYGNELSSEIVLAPLQNMDAVIGKKFFLQRPWYAVTGSDQTGKVCSVLRVDAFSKKLILEDKLQKTKAVVCFEGSETEERMLEMISNQMSDSFWDFFKIDKEVLFQKISRILTDFSKVKNIFLKLKIPVSPTPGS